MYSMTGYGRAEYSCDGFTLTIEMKSVNNRNFDFNCKCPRSFMAFEDLIRKTVQNRVARGRIDLFVSYSDMREEDNAVSVNLEKAASYYNAGKMIADSLNIENDLSVASLMKMPDVVVDDSLTDYSGFEQNVVDTVNAAIDKFNEMRLAEGNRLVSDMLSRMETIEKLVQSIKERAPFVATEYREKLAERIKEALGDVKMDETRLLNEVAIYTDKVNIDEELTRLFSHVAQFRSITENEKSGKKLDFLMQEFNREANTICSKSNDITVTKYALELKNEIEKVREQVQNLE